MADPVSATGTAVGIISLGIQASQGLIEYYSQWKNLDADVNSMYVSVEQLDRGFRLVKDKVEGETFAMLPSANEAEASIRLCEAGVLELKRKLEKIKAREPLGRLSRKDAFLNDLKHQGKRLLYPFQRGTLGKLRDVVNDLRDGLQPVFHAVQMDIGELLLDGVNQIRHSLHRSHLDEEAQKARSWLSPLEFHERHQEILSARHPSTGSLFLEDKKFLAWRDAAPGAPRGLWCFGNMGTGKSVLLASMIEHLNLMPDSVGTAVVYVFCNWQERMAQTEANLLGSIVQQMTESFPEMPVVVTHLYKAYKNGKHPPSVQDLFTMFRELARLLDRVFVIVDGLDELGSGNPVSQGVSMSAMEGILRSLLNQDNVKSPKVSLLISSRFEPQLSNGPKTFEMSVVTAAAEEIRAYVRSELQSTTQAVPWINPQLGLRIFRDAELRNLVAELCITRANHTFLLPRLHINHLKQHINLKQLLKAARTLSIDISRSIDQALDRIQSQAETLKDVAKRALYWVLKALRPLHIDELRYALNLDINGGVVSDDDSGPDEDFLQTTDSDEELIPEALIVTACAGLISVNDQTGIVRLIHLSIMQYLGHLENRWFPPIHAAISKACVTYLSSDDFATPGSGKESLFKDLLPKHPFLGYALEFWGSHVRLASEEEEILGHIQTLMISDDRVDFLFHGLYWVLWGTLDPSPNQIPGLFLTSYFGLINATRNLLKNGSEVDQIDSMGRTPLYIASALGHTEIVKELFNSKADVEGRKPVTLSGRESSYAWWLPPWARDDNGSHALCVAAESGHIETVKVLIEHGADVSARGRYHDGALEGATFWGHTAVVKLLLLHNAVITRNALLCSAYAGRLDILEEYLRTLEPRADPEMVTERAATQDLPKALYASALAGNTSYTERLLKYGIDPNLSTLTSYRTPLQAAASQGHLSTMKLLLQYGADINFEADCKDFYLLSKPYCNNATPGTALQAATFKGKIEAVDILLQEGANIDAQSGYYGTALQAAAAGGRYDILESLLRRGADVNLRCGFFDSPIQAAASTGSEALVQALLNARADVSALGGVFGSALQAAAISGNPVVIKLLLDAGAEPNKQGGRFGNALQAAALGCPLVERDPQLNIPKASSLPLEFQSYANRGLDMLMVMNMRASQVAGSMMRQATEYVRRNPMAGAANLFPGIEQSVLLTNEGEARHEILEASQNSIENIEAVKQLLDAGIDVDKAGGRFHSALQAACYAGHLGVVNLLLDRGADIDALYVEEDDHPWTRQNALTRAIESGHTQIVKCLLERGADLISTSVKAGLSPLHRAVKQNKDMVGLLLQYGVEVNEFDGLWDTPIGNAVSERKTEIVKLLISKGADVNLRSSSSNSVLTQSTRSGSVEMIKAILDAGATAESINETLVTVLQGNTLLYFKGDWIPRVRDPLRLLLDYGANVNVGGTVADRDVTVEEIRENNRFPPRYTEGLNPLSMVASQFGDNIVLVEMIVDAGADLTRFGRDALWLAKRYEHVMIQEYLAGLGVEPESESEPEPKEEALVVDNDSESGSDSRGEEDFEMVDVERVMDWS